MYYSIIVFYTLPMAGSSLPSTGVAMCRSTLATSPGAHIATESIRGESLLGTGVLFRGLAGGDIAFV